MERLDRDGGGAREVGGGKVCGGREGAGGSHDGPEGGLVVVGAGVGVGVLRGRRAGGGGSHHGAARVYRQFDAVPLVGRRVGALPSSGHPYTKPKATINL